MKSSKEIASIVSNAKCEWKSTYESQNIMKDISDNNTSATKAYIDLNIKYAKSIYSGKIDRIGAARVIAEYAARAVVTEFLNTEEFKEYKRYELKKLVDLEEIEEYVTKKLGIFTLRQFYISYIFLAVLLFVALIVSKITVGAISLIFIFYLFVGLISVLMFMFMYLGGKL